MTIGEGVAIALVRRGRLKVCFRDAAILFDGWYLSSRAKSGRIVIVAGEEMTRSASPKAILNSLEYCPLFKKRYTVVNITGKDGRTRSKAVRLFVLDLRKRSKKNKEKR